MNRQMETYFKKTDYFARVKDGKIYLVTGYLGVVIPSDECVISLRIPKEGEWYKIDMNGQTLYKDASRFMTALFSPDNLSVLHDSRCVVHLDNKKQLHVYLTDEDHNIFIDQSFVDIVTKNAGEPAEIMGTDARSPVYYFDTDMRVIGLVMPVNPMTCPVRVRSELPL